MMTRQPTVAADKIIKYYESCKLVAYLDAKGVPTIGWGHTRGVKMGDTCTQAQADQWYIEDRQESIDTIYRNLDPALIESLSNECYDALVSFIFNVGNQAFTNPVTGKRTDFYGTITTNLAGVPDQMKRWVRSGNQVLGGLEKRRGEEAGLWIQGLPSQGGVSEIEAKTESGVRPDVPPPVAPPASATTGAAAGVVGLTGAGTLLVQTAQTLGTGATSPFVLWAVAGMIVVGVVILCWAWWRTHRAGKA